MGMPAQQGFRLQATISEPLLITSQVSNNFWVTQSSPEIG